MVIIFILTLYVKNGTFRANVYAAAAVEHRAQMHGAKNVYKATISPQLRNTNSIKHCIGMTANTFKGRYRNHIKVARYSF